MTEARRNLVMAPPRRGPGFRKLDPVTGLDKRGRVGRRRAKPV